MTSPLKIKTYAKINLYLDVVGKYPDGFHAIESIFQTITLSDTLIFDEISEGVEIITNKPSLPVDGSNIVYKTINKVKEITKIKKGIRVQILKNIPVCAGLGGGSSNAAGTLHALNILWELGWNESTLQNIAVELGSDVPYFIRGGTQSVSSKGERLSTLPYMPDMWIVLVHPAIALSTAKVYQHPSLVSRPHHKKQDEYSLTFKMAISALMKQDWGKVIYNQLEIPAFVIAPELRELKLKIKKMGFPYVGMSGSGSTFFILVESKRQGERLMKKINMNTNLVRTNKSSIQLI
ncbi:MAG TPA: 4-(cytidine 5'-diphospho)-2-C-methyl-D-erythritol kinase [Candidatus Hydrogenedens sp.]|nr:4-(cytidine 5'-diphospho)-2-C-methyl-D-erythritol kinase [Candidatus Hydrogenedens sp.]